MGCKSKYIKSQIDYGWLSTGKSGKQRQNNKRKGTHIIRQKQKRDLQKEIREG